MAPQERLRQYENFVSRVARRSGSGKARQGAPAGIGSVQGRDLKGQNISTKSALVGQQPEWLDAGSKRFRHQVKKAGLTPLV